MQWPPHPPVANPYIPYIKHSPLHLTAPEKRALQQSILSFPDLDREIQTSVLSTSTYTYLTHELARKSGSEICMHTHALGVPSPGREQAASPCNGLGPDQVHKCASTVCLDCHFGGWQTPCWRPLSAANTPGSGTRWSQRMHTPRD